MSALANTDPFIESTPGIKDKCRTRAILLNSLEAELKAVKRLKAKRDTDQLDLVGC